MKLTKNRFFPILIIILASIIFYLPIFIKPTLFVDRNNDLQEFFWPIYYFVKEQIIHNHQVPFWNNMFLSGTPLLPDPQAPFFYLPNIIFLILPINAGFIISSFLHAILGGIGAYLVGRKVFNLKKSSSIFTAVLFIFSPKLAGYIEAGHFGLILSWAYLPWLFLSTVMLIKKPKLLWSLGLALSSIGLFYTHSTTFLYSVIISSFIFIFLLIRTNNKIRKLGYFSIGGVLAFGLCAIALLPQLNWIPQTNRYLLAQNPQVYPLWNTKTEFIRQIVLPQNSDSEKWIPLGIISIFLAFIGLGKVNKINKIFLGILTVLVLIISANNLTPFYGFLLSQKWYDYLRVSTRTWFVISLSVSFLAGIGYETIMTKFKRKNYPHLILYLTAIELLTLSWIRLFKPAPNQEYAPKAVYEYLAKDKDIFRVFCTNRCLSQKEAAIYHLELVDGYSTLIQKNYNSHAYQLTGTYWNYYTLSIPPIGAFAGGERLQPNIKSLGEYNTKYIISPYEINDLDLLLVSKIGNYLIYKNQLYKPRFPVPIVKHTPNYIRIDTSNYHEKSIVISEVFNPDWVAFLNGNKKANIQETPDALREVDINSETKFIDFRYNPKGFELGKHITFLTILSLIAFGVYRKCRKK